MRSKRPSAELGAANGEHALQHELRSFGRRRGRKLSPRQQHLLDDLLPRVALPLAVPCLERPGDLFQPPASRVWLEIGFGGGEHLAWQARANPDVGIIGCEVFEDGVVKLLSAIEGDNLSNVRICAEDAREALRWLPAGVVERVFILFPDPWPKKRHVKRRLINRGLLDELARVMLPGGELRIGTDIGDYLRTILISLRGHPAFAWRADGPGDWRQRGPDWPPTRYEAKAEREGRRRYFLRLVRVQGP